MEPKSDGRIAQSFSISAPVEYEGDQIRGSGITGNVSLAGLLLEYVSTPVAQGKELRLRISLYPGSFDVEFRAHVVRQTDRGFEVQFVDPTPEQKKVLSACLPKSADPGNGQGA